MEYDKSKILWEGSKKELNEGSEEVVVVWLLEEVVVVWLLEEVVVVVWLLEGLDE
jgi:hypothetical protein